MGKNYEMLLQNRIRCSKNCLQKVIYERAEAMGELIGDKITEKIGKPISVPEENLKNVE